MKNFFTLFLFSCVLTGVFGQNVKKSSGEYQINLSRSDLSEAEACQRCIEIAMVEAIEKQFGRVLIQGNTTIVENTQTGEKVETTQIFNMIAETYVNGEWVETTNESCDRFVENDEFWVKCKVKGKVRELQKPKIDLVAKALDCEEEQCETFEFQDGESFYLYLKSPVDGYVSVYIGDPSATQRLFPYREMPKGMLNGVKVEADEEYILFSTAKDQLDLRPYVDEYEMYASSDVDQNRIYVIYSKKPLTKPALYQNESEPDFEMPLELPPEDFQKWLAKQKRYNEDMEVFRVDIYVKK